jgi:O-antigen/teichoic acid export membrane protein
MPVRAGGVVARTGQRQGGGGQAGLGDVARGSTLNLAGALVAALGTFGLTVVVTRAFHKGIAGSFFTATSAFLIIETLATLGANNGLVYFIARLRSFGEDRRIRVILRSAALAVALASLLTMVALFVFAVPVARVFLGGGGAKGAGVTVPAVADSLRVLALAMPFAALLDTFTGATRGYRQMRPTVIVDKMGRTVLQMVGVGAAALLGSSALIAPMWALPYVPAAAVVLWWLVRIRRKPAKRPPDPGAVPPELAILLAMATPLPGSKPVLPPKRKVGSRIARRQVANANPRGFWRFTVPRAIASVAGITVQRLGIVLVAVFHGPNPAAVFTAASRFLVAGQLGNTAIINAAQPRFTELFSNNDRAGANAVYRVTTAWLVLITWPMYLLSIVYGAEILKVFGKSYSAGYTVMLILSASMLFSMACGQVDMVLVTTGRSSWSLMNGLMCVVINVVLDILLIPRYGITGASIGWAGAIVVSNVIPLIQLAVVFRLHPFGRSMISSCALCALSYGLIPLGVRVALGDGLAGLAVGVIAGSVVFAGGLWWLRVSLQLAHMPGASAIAKRLDRRRANRTPDYR